MRELFQRAEYDKALERLENSEIKSLEENRLLYLLQRGKLLRALGKNQLAAQDFVEASELVDKLYTKSVKEALLTGLTNDNSETYYGNPYERSLLFYYQALSFLDIYQNGYVLEKVSLVESKQDKKDKKDKKEAKEQWVKKKLSEQERKRYLFRARASIVAWDTFYKELQRSSREDTIFDHDLFAKILGAKIHEMVGKRADYQISLQLYKDAYELLHRIGPAFKAFNKNFESYAQKLALGEAGKGEIQKTEHFQNLEDFLKVKILKLTKSHQSYQYKKTLKKLAPSKSVLQEVSANPNTTLILEAKAVAPLVGEDFSYNLRSAIEKVEDPVAKEFISKLGVPVLTYFAMGPLGLGSVASSGNSKLYVRHGIGEAMAAEVGVEFEMPVIKEPDFPEIREIFIYKLEGEQEKLVASKKLVLAGAISDQAYQSNLEIASNAYTERGARIAIKHIIAIIAAYKTYEAIKASSGEMFAKPAAFAQYLVSAKGIKESERADTRQWSVLPSEIFLGELSLGPGDYILRAKKTESSGPNSAQNSAQVQEKPLSSFRVKPGSSQQVFTFIAP